jgi:hypothetical protein
MHTQVLHHVYARGDARANVMVHLVHIIVAMLVIMIDVSSIL